MGGGRGRRERPNYDHLGKTTEGSGLELCNVGVLEHDGPHECVFLNQPLGPPGISQVQQITWLLRCSSYVSKFAPI